MVQGHAENLQIVRQFNIFVLTYSLFQFHQLWAQALKSHIDTNKLEAFENACIAPQAWFFCNGEEKFLTSFLRNIPVKFGKNPVNSFRGKVLKKKFTNSHR